jgi:chromate reductase
MTTYTAGPQMNAIEACIQFTPDLIDDRGHVTNESTVAFLRKYKSELHAFITRVYLALPRPGE